MLRTGFVGLENDSIVTITGDSLVNCVFPHFFQERTSKVRLITLPVRKLLRQVTIKV
jgi:hypothetical protein